MYRIVLCAAVSSLMLSTGCGGDDDGCDVVAQSGCDDGKVCERVEGGEPACFEPVQLRGSVFDLTDGAGIEGARVVALDENRAPISTVVLTDQNGDYALPIPSDRDADGNPAAVELTLRADADGYQSFPSGLRVALPIDTAAAMQEGDEEPWELQVPQTEIGLTSVEAGTGAGIISGSVELPDGGAGVLVVAEGPSVGNAIADRDGDYAIYNLSDGSYQVRAYALGHNYSPEEADVAGSEVDVDLALSDAPTSTVSGKIELADPGDGTGTSIILVVASTFNETIARGQTPPGLRAPDPGLAPDISGDFTIEGVPEGEYVILAAFENDELVRDPDQCIAGTDLVYQSVGTDEIIDIADSFKVTGALTLTSPGATGLEITTATPTFDFVNDSSAKEYDIQVFDTFGNEVWSTTVVDDSAPQSVPYAGPALISGLVYQWRVTSYRFTGGTNGERCAISQTEDLEGLFQVE